jgi:hypothetical protein
MKKTACLLLFCALLIATLTFVAGCGEDESKIAAAKLAAAKPGELSEDDIDKLPEGKREVFERDKTGREWVSAKERDYVEARAWFKREKIMGFEMSAQDMSDIAEKLYTAGAKKVYVTGISTMSPSDVEGGPEKGSAEDKAQTVEIAASMAAELPDDPAARKTTIEAAAALLEEIEGVDYPTEDLEQRYIAFYLD